VHQACADNGVHTLLAVKGTSQMLPAGSEDDHFSNHKSIGREVGARWIKFLFHSSGGMSSKGTTVGSKKRKGGWKGMSC